MARRALPLRRQRADAARPRAAGRSTDPAELATHLRIRQAGLRRRAAPLRRLRPRRATTTTPATVHVLGFVDGVPAGTVRLYPLGGRRVEGRPAGGAPDAPARGGLGAPLVRYAVATAGALGGRADGAPSPAGERAPSSGASAGPRSASRPTIVGLLHQADDDRPARDRRRSLVTRAEVGDTLRCAGRTPSTCLAVAAQPHLAGVVQHADRLGGQAALGERRRRSVDPRLRAARAGRRSRGSSRASRRARRRRARAAGRGRPSRPSRPGSSSMASDPTSPAMLTSLAATATPLAASSASSRTSPASRGPRSSNEGKNGKSGRIAPSMQQPSTSAWPGAALRGRQHPVRAADPEGRQRQAAPSVRVRWPPTIGHVVELGGPPHAAEHLAGDRLGTDHRVHDRRAVGRPSRPGR